MTVDLVCEGLCNAVRYEVEARVAQWRRGEGRAKTNGTGETVMPPVPAGLAADLRRLRHTAHVEAHGEGYLCDTCGRARRWG